MFTLGPTRSTGMGETATDFPAIESFLRTTQRDLTPWEVELLHDMCLAFTREYLGSDDPFSIAPVDRED